jgi:tryptophan-rich sensory protein
MQMASGKIIRLAAAIAVCELAGVIGSFFTFSAIPAWYAGLQKPWFAPPSWVFAPVWLALYAMMGAAIYLVWERAGRSRRGFRPMAAFAFQLALNTLWSVIFFGLRSPAAAFGEILALWLAIAYTAYEFRKVDKRAFALMLPYIAWVSVAAALNYYVWVLNA